jgi:hypothetical protein
MPETKMPGLISQNDVDMSKRERRLISPGLENAKIPFPGMVMSSVDEENLS